MASMSTGSDVISSSSMDEQPSTSTKDAEEKEMDEQSKFELLHAMERVLESGKFLKAAAALRKEINERKLVPSRTDFEGTEHVQNYGQFLNALSNLPSTSRLTGDSLPTMLSRLSALSDRAIVPPVKGLKLRLITNRRSLMQRTNEVLIPPHRPNLIHGRRGHVQVLKTKHSPLEFLRARELGSRVPPSLLPGERSIELIERHFRILGHLANVFCVAFDRTENYLITGADDNLVKVWTVNQAMLKFTYRGHSAEIADLAVSYCNQLVASGSNDKSIRVWRLQNGETLQVFKHHTASVTSVKFLPYTGNGTMRYLVTTGNDCIVNIYMFNEETLEFPSQNGLIYQRYERDQPGAKMVSTCNSPGGHVFAIGESHGVIRVYRIHEGGEIEKMNDITAHTDRVDSLMWAHSGLRFCSGSKDGTAKIWRFQYGEWQQTVLSLSQSELFQICGANAAQNNPNSKNKYKVSMVCWTLDDSRIATTASEHSFRVWDAITGAQLLKLCLHTDDAFHLCAHPLHPHLIISSGHDGLIAMWDVVRGVVVHKWTNTVEQGEQAAVFDLSLTRDGTRFAIVDNKGHVSLYGLGTNKKKITRTQFFNTDYSPIVLDARGFSIDESTEIAPHLMPPPLLINTDLEVYGPEIQAMVPGRDLGGDVDEDSLVCPWLTRNIVPRLSENELESWAERKLILARMESEECEREKTRERPSSTPVVTPIVPFSSRRGISVRASRPTSFHAAIAAENAIAQARRSENRRERTTQAHAMALLRRDISMRYIGVEPDENDQDIDRADGIIDNEVVEEETDTSDSDYESDGGERARERAREREPSWQGTVSRPRRRETREVVVVEVDPELDESSQHSRSERRTRRRRGEEDEFGNDLSIDMYDPLPSTSSGRARRGGRRVENHDDMERPERSIGRNRRTPRSAERQEEEDEEIEVEEPGQDTVVSEERSRRQPSARDGSLSSFPDWMREVKRKRFPYVAQIGDHVVYFRQGHEHYLTEVEKMRLYFVNAKMIPKDDIGMEEFAVVDDIKYLLKPYRLTQLKLAKTDSEGRRTGVTWSVKLHDMDNVPDFIILRAFYEEGLAMALDVGDEIEAAIDDAWWMGTVENMNKNEAYPDAHWQSIGVRWATGDDDALSLWDMRKKVRDRALGESVSEEDVTSMGSVPYCDGDWPEGDENGDAIRRRIKRTIRELCECETIKVFSAPVPLGQYHDYPSKVAYPTDLQTICERIDNQYYRRLRSLLQDIRYIALSAETYNIKGAPIVKNARVFVEAVVRIVNDPSIEGFTAFYDSCYDLDETEIMEYKRKPRPEVNPEMLAILREGEMARGSEAEGSVPLAGWARDSIEVLEDLMQQPCARHFATKDDNDEELAPVWDTCDDLRTLCERVRGGAMNTPKELEIAICSFVSTAKNSIENRRSEIYKDLVALQSQFNHRFKGIITKFESSQASVQMQLGVSIDRSLRRRPRDTHQHAYNTRRSDHSALAAVAEMDDDLPSSSSRNAARHERGFYRNMANGGGGAGAYGSGEMEVSSSSNNRMTSRRGGMSFRGASNRMVQREEEPRDLQRLRMARHSSNHSSHNLRRVIIDTEEEDADGDEEEDDETIMGLAPSDDEIEENGEDPVQEEDEEEGGDSEDEDVEEEEEEYSTRQAKKSTRVSKRKAESTEEEESAAASTSTASSTRRSNRTRKVRRVSSEEEEEEEEVTSRSRGKKKGSTRPTRAAAQHFQHIYDERSDEEEEEPRVTNSVSQRGRQRRPRIIED